MVLGKVLKLPFFMPQFLILYNSLPHIVHFFCLSGIVWGQTEESMFENHPHKCAEFFDKWDDPASYCKPPQFEGLPAEVRPGQG